MLRPAAASLLLCLLALAGCADGGKDAAAAEKDAKPAESKENPGETKKEQSVSGT